MSQLPFFDLCAVLSVLRVCVNGVVFFVCDSVTWVCLVLCVVLFLLLVVVCLLAFLVCLFVCLSLVRSIMMLFR